MSAVCGARSPHPQPLSRKRTGGAILLALLTALVSTAAADDSSTDQRFLAGLRERGLYQLAERYCDDRLAQPDLPPARRADLVAELSLVLAERAASSPPADRPALWKRALAVTGEFAEKYPDNPRLVQVQLQGALGVLAHGELARQEAELSANRESLLEQSQTELREAIARLRQLADTVETMLRRQDPRAATPDALTNEQLESLALSIQYELARAYRNQGQSYPPGSEDRADSLNQAVGLLDGLTRLDSNHPLAFRSRIDQVACYRLLQNATTARQRLDTLLAQLPPPAIRLRAQAEQIRLALAADDLAQAMKLLAAGRTLDGVTSPELDMAWLETFIAQWRAAQKAKNEKEAESWYAKAADQVRRIERDHGPYWMRRAETLLAGSVSGLADGGDLATTIRAAEAFYRSGRLDDALAAYDRARAQAAAAGDRAQAFQAGFLAATIKHQQQQFQQAADRYRELAVAMPNEAKAPQAHALAIQDAAELAKGSDPAALERYASLLDEHRQLWPRDPGTDRVRWLSARLGEYRRQWEDAIRAYREITPSDPQYAAAVEAAGRCYQAWLSELKAAGKPTERLAAEAAVWFESLVLGSGNRLPERWSPAQAAAALSAARLWLGYTRSGFGRAERILSAALAGANESSEAWKSDARGLLVYSLAALGRDREAGQVLTEISAGSPAGLLSMLDGLSRVTADAEPTVRPELAALQLQAIKLLEPRRGQLDEQQTQTLQRLEAQALADAGHTDDALRAYRTLADRYPRDGRIQKGYAQLLLEQKDRASWATGIQRWREIAKHSRPGTDGWFQAKYAVALLHYRQGDKARAADIIRQLEVLYPELGGPELAARFRQLLDQCGSP